MDNYKRVDGKLYHVGTTRGRLAYYRAMVEQYPSTTWKHWHHKSLPATIGKSEDGKKWYLDDIETIGEDVGAAHDIARISHAGWYADNYQESLIIGHVARMRTSKGVYYIPYTVCNGWDGITAYIQDAVIVPRGSDEDAHEEAKREAAGYADDCAQYEAEESREYHAKDQAEQDILSALEEIADTRKHIHALFNELRNTLLPATLCAELRGNIKGYRREIHKLIKVIRARREDYWSAVQY